MLVSPSLISADLTRLGDQISTCEKAAPFSYHVDVMDGHFVDNITIGHDFTAAVRKCTDRRIECHLMIDRPDRYYGRFVSAGASSLLCHVESPVAVGKLFKKFSDEGIDYGVVINPETPLESALPYLDGASTLLIMSVHPGFSGQGFMPEVLEKLKEASRYIHDNSLNVRLEIDGGINGETGPLARDAGAEIVVSGSYIFGGNILERIETLRNL